MRRLAMLFALIALISPAQLFTGHRFAGVGSRVVNTIARVRRFLDRRMKMLPVGRVAARSQAFTISRRNASAA
jgi:hypothetical protein